MAAAFRHLLKACLPSDAHESPPATRQNSVNEEQSREADSKALFAGEDPNRQASTSTALPEYEPRSQESEEQQKQIIYDEPEGENQGSEPPEMEQPKIITSSPVATAQDTELQLHQSPVSDNDSSQPAPIVAESPDEVGPDPERQSPWKRPILERLPSESLSASSETSQQSDTNEPDSSLPDQTPQKQAKRPKPLQQFSESKQLSSGLLNPDTSLSSSFGHISEPSTPQGFLRHRHSTSLNSAREVRETLDAYMPTPSDEEPDGPENPATYNRTRRCNQYRIGRPLGKGSAASVYVAEDDQGNAFACKEFSKSMLRRRKKSELLRARRGGRGPLNQLEKQEKNDPLTLVRTEIAIMKKLHHPNLVQLHEVLDVPDNDSLFLSTAAVCFALPCVNSITL